MTLQDEITLLQDSKPTCLKCCTEMNKRIAQWKIDGGDTPYFHPLANMDAVHFITVFAMKMGIGGTLCHEWQGMVAPK